MGPNKRGWFNDCEIVDHAAPRRTVFESARAAGHSEACSTRQHMAMVNTCTCSTSMPDQRRKGRPAWRRVNTSDGAITSAESAARQESPNGEASLREVVLHLRSMPVGRHGHLPQSAVIANANAWRDEYPRAVA